jgi:hypothetical protein
MVKEINMDMRSMEEDKGYKSVSVDRLERIIRLHFKSLIKNCDLTKRLINRFQYFNNDKYESISFSVNLAMLDTAKEFEKCDFTSLSLAGFEEMIEKSVAEVTAKSVHARISEFEFSVKNTGESNFHFYVAVTQEVYEPSMYTW